MVFPSQDAESVKRTIQGTMTQAESEKAQQDAEARQDLFFMLALMCCVALLITVVMVRSNFSSAPLFLC